MRAEPTTPEIVTETDHDAEPCDPAELDRVLADMLLDMGAEDVQDRSLPGPRLMRPAERRTVRPRPQVPWWMREERRLEALAEARARARRRRLLAAAG
jgi:hypothetical protein